MIEECKIIKINALYSKSLLSPLGGKKLKFLLLRFFYLLNSWLKDFAYKTDIEWWIFLLAGGISICIAFFTISFQSFRAALTNPVESLRNE